MKIKNFYILLFIISVSSVSFPQFSPQSFYMTKDGRMRKTAANPTISSSNVSDIITIGDTIWAGTGQGLSLSTDNGNTWKNFTNDQTFGTEGISAIGYYKGTFWAATAHDENTSQGPVPTGSGLRYTTDFGKTWTIIPQPVDNDSDSVVVYGINHLHALAVTVPEQNVIYDMAFTPGTIWIATWAGGVRKARIDSLLIDPSYKWQRVILPPDNLDSIKPTDTLDFCYTPVAGKICTEDNLNLRGFSVLAVNDSTVYAGTAGGLNKTTDANSEYPSWIKFSHTNENNPISGNFVVALGYNKSNNTVWAASWQAEGSSEFYGVSYTTDGGANWRTSLNGEKVHNFAFNDNQVIAPSDDGAFRTTDNGANWILPSSIVDANSGVSIASTTFYAAGFNNNYVWLGADDGLARLAENPGSIWDGKWTVYFASQPLSSTSSTYAYPNPFNPRTDILKIKYSTNGNDVPVTIRIFDFGMHIVRTVVQNATRGATHSIDQAGGVVDYWDGLDDAGNMVPNGVYFYSVDAGSGKPIYGKIIVIH